VATADWVTGLLLMAAAVAATYTIITKLLVPCVRGVCRAISWIVAIRRRWRQIGEIIDEEHQRRERKKRSKH